MRDPSCRHFPVAKFLIEDPWYWWRINAKTAISWRLTLAYASTIALTWAINSSVIFFCFFCIFHLLSWMSDCLPEKCFTRLKNSFFQRGRCMAWSMYVSIADADFPTVMQTFIYHFSHECLLVPIWKDLRNGNQCTKSDESWTKGYIKYSTFKCCHMSYVYCKLVVIQFRGSLILLASTLVIMSLYRCFHVPMCPPTDLC